MRIKELTLNKWNVIREAHFENLSDFVIIAGPNGVGKTWIKEAIVYIFRNNGSPPPGSKVVLESTNQEELDTWKTKEFTLPQNFFTSILHRQNKRLKTKSKLIQIDANRSIDSLNFGQLTFAQIGNPEEEMVGYDYGYNLVKDRFKDICQTLLRLKSKEVMAVYNEYYKNLDPSSNSITLGKFPDPTEKYIQIFGQLLYPKKMRPIDINSSTIEFYDEDGDIRNFPQLSSGEKEVVILTFDILTQNPSDCIILIDEPEVHLHPELMFRLIKVLKSIGEKNQFFLFTHSADIIGNSLDTGIHFIRPKSRIVTGNQVIRIDENNIEGFKNIPNIRETIGMVSIGKKLLFVEGDNTSIDRNIFATIAKASKIDMAIIPSNSCSNINNMSLICDTLEKGLFGIELFMVRDRDGLTKEQIDNFILKSKGRIIFLPFYHIENAFLDPQAISIVAKKVLLNSAQSLNEIEDKLIELAKDQINHVITLYVKSEIYFAAGNFDVSPKIDLNKSTPISDIKNAINQRKTELLKQYNTTFNEAYIETRLTYWKSLLENSIKSGWSNEAKKHFIGKRMIKELQSWMFGTKSILLWEHIINTEEEVCRNAYKELTDIINKI